MRLPFYALSLGAAASIPLIALAAAEPAETLPAGHTASAQAEEGAAADVTGRRLCPSCGKLNGPEASFCVSCGRDLDIGRRGPARRPGPRVSLEPNLSFLYSFTNLGPGFSFAIEGSRFREQATTFAVLDADYGFEFDGAFVASDTHIYLTTYKLMPYVDIGLILWAYEDVIVEFYPGAGVRYVYDGRGSFFYCSAGFGARAFPTWEEYGPDAYEWNSQFSAKYHLTQYYAAHAGVTFAAQTFFGGGVITVGHAFSF